MTELPELSGPTLLLRPLGRQDQSLYTGLYGHPDTMGRIMPALDAPRARRAFEAQLLELAGARPARLTWTLAEKPDGQPFGLLGLVRDANGGAEIGVVLPPGRQGKGHATEAIATVADHVFQDPGFSCLYTRHASGHEPAAALMRRLGFEPAPGGAPPHPVRWMLRNQAWRRARRDKPGPFS